MSGCRCEFPARAYLRLGRVAPGGSEACGAEGLSLEGGPQGGGAEAHSGGHCKSWYLRLRCGRGGASNTKLREEVKKSECWDKLEKKAQPERSGLQQADRPGPSSSTFFPWPAPPAQHSIKHHCPTKGAPSWPAKNSMLESLIYCSSGLCIPSSSLCPSSVWATDLRAPVTSSLCRVLLPVS